MFSLPGGNAQLARCKEKFLCNWVLRRAPRGDADRDRPQGLAERPVVVGNERGNVSVARGALE
jgi:hypothetical protein